MGQTLKNLSKRKLSDKWIFKNRFVVEICEKVHVHYRNLRIIQSLYDFISMAEAFKDSMDRWQKRGCPSPRSGQHIELCRKNIRNESDINSIEINLNKNLYNVHKDQVFSEGANFEDDEYIHLKIRDVRVELSKDDFKELALSVKEAEERLNGSDMCSDVQA